MAFDAGTFVKMLGASLHENISLVAIFKAFFNSLGLICLLCLQLLFRYIRRGQLNDGFPLFETESLKYPGFVEFDDVNGKVLTFSAQDR